MIKQALLPILAVMALSVPAMAQDSGGVPLAPGIKGGPVGLARPLPFVRQPFATALSVQNGMTATDHQTADQNAITQLRGDPGFLSGFLQGQPLAASRQPPVPNDGGWYWHHHHHQGQGQVLGGGQGQALGGGQGQALGGGQGQVFGQGHGHDRGPTIINSTGPFAVTVGNDNLVQQQSATGSGPTAQQQVATLPSAGSHSGGAVNLVSGSGNIIQRAPSGN
jgi:hypothetical protein